MAGSGINGEVWREVPSAPGLLVSSEGRVMVKPHRKRMPHGGERQYGGQPHFGVWAKDSGRFITRQHGKTFKVARLVCEAFHGPAPADAPVCMHLDENAANNRADNLAWGTQKENLNAPAVKAYHRSGGAGERDYAATMKHRGEAA